MSELADIVAGDGHHGPEILETGVGHAVMDIIRSLAPRLRAALAIEGKLHDCWRAAPLWEYELTASGVSVRTCSEPDPDDQPRCDFSVMTDAERGGYEIDGGELKRHVWLAVGLDLLLFDPTGHQFDGYGRAEIARYWRQHAGARITFTEWRERELRGR